MDNNAFEVGLSYQVDRQVTEQELRQRRENFEAAKAKAHALPLNPGCYLMKDESGNVIYVGKAKSLDNAEYVCNKCGMHHACVQTSCSTR